MIVLDTNVLSTMMQPNPDPAVRAWLDAQAPSALWTTAVSVLEVQLGLEIMPAGRKKLTLQKAFDLAVQQDLANQILVFDTTAALESAALAAKLRSMGRPIDIRDVMIAGTVVAHQATLATRNTKHFADTGVQLVDPWLFVRP
jgi:predicted nucleic acid-binding protein